MADGPLAVLGPGELSARLARPADAAAGTACAGRCSTAIPARWPRSPARSACWPTSARCTSSRSWRSGTLLVAGSLVGSMFCGWACPFGFLQDLIGNIPTPKLRLPGWMGWTRYAVLIGLVLLLPYFFGERHGSSSAGSARRGRWRPRAPTSCSNRWPKGARLADNRQISILALFLLAALFTWRPWCTVFCPLAQSSVCAIMSRWCSSVFSRNAARLRPLPRFVQVSRACRTAGSDFALHPLPGVRQLSALSVGNVFQKDDQPLVQIDKL